MRIYYDKNLWVIEKEQVIEMDETELWKEKARANIEKWGYQSLKDTSLAMTEELGEMVQAVLQFHHEKGSYKRIGEELDDLAALCYQMKWTLYRGMK